MVVPNGPAAARSSSTWIHWWSWVRSANASTWGWVTIDHGVGPRRTPSASARSAYSREREAAMTSGTGRLLRGERCGSLAEPALGDGPAVGLRGAVVDPERAHLAVVARQQRVAGDAERAADLEGAV